MPGLRGRQKRARREAILDAALTLFDRKGYDATAIEEIAQGAGVSVPTLYRYFRSKGELLLAIQRVDIEDLARKGQGVLDSLPGDPVDALCALIEAHNADMFDSVPGSRTLELWRVVVSEAIRSPEVVGRSYYLGDAVLVRQTQNLCDALVARGLLRVDIDTGEVAELLTFVARGYFRMRLLGADITNDQIRASLRSHVTAIFRGLAPPGAHRPRQGSGDRRAGARGALSRMK